MGERKVRLEIDRLANQFGRKILATDLMGDNSKKMPRVGVVGVHGEDLAAERLGLPKSPGLMVLKCLFEGFLSGHRP